MVGPGVASPFRQRVGMIETNTRRSGCARICTRSPRNEGVRRCGFMTTCYFRISLAGHSTPGQRPAPDFLHLGAGLGAVVRPRHGSPGSTPPPASNPARGRLRRRRHDLRLVIAASNRKRGLSSGARLPAGRPGGATPFCGSLSGSPVVSFLRRPGGSPWALPAVVRPVGCTKVARSPLRLPDHRAAGLGRTITYAIRHLRGPCEVVTIREPPGNHQPVAKPLTRRPVGPSSAGRWH